MGRKERIELPVIDTEAGVYAGVKVPHDEGIMDNETARRLIREAYEDGARSILPQEGSHARWEAGYLPSPDYSYVLSTYRQIQRAINVADRENRRRKTRGSSGATGDATVVRRRVIEGPWEFLDGTLAGDRVVS